MIKLFLSVLKRDLLLGYRSRADILVALFFFIIVISLFPVGLEADHKNLPQLAPGLVWVAALLAGILSLDRLFEQDYNDGCLDELLSSSSVYTCVLAKISAHWLLTGFPLVIISPLVGLAYNLEFNEIGVLMLSLLLGTPLLSLLGAIGASLTLGLRNGSSLIALLILPLNLPVMVFGAAAIRESIKATENAGVYLLFLAAMLIIALIFAPLAAAAGLKISND